MRCTLEVLRAEMLGSVRSLSKRSHDLISREPIAFLDVFELVAAAIYRSTVATSIRVALIQGLR
jgi:hypothetical protein